MNVTKEEFEKVLVENPTLKDHGFEYGNITTNPIVFSDFERSVNWMIENLKPTKTYSSDSYQLKHMIEFDNKNYTPNGAAIAAAIYLKIPYKRFKPKKSPNASFKAKVVKEAINRFYNKNGC